MYYGIRADFGVSSQLTVRCIAKVADAYKRDKKTLRTFAPVGSVAFDSRILTFDVAASTVAIWTLDGQQTIPFVCGARQRRLLATQQGESDLAYRDGQWYVCATCAVQTPTMQVPTGVLGVDLGVTNIAVDSDGEIHRGKAITNIRYRHRSLRNKLQRKGTRGSRRRLRKLAGQERRFATWVNHTLRTKIVAKAEGTTRAISLEDLKGIRTRVTVRRSQRATLQSWAFFQLRAFIVYKAALAGVDVHLVDPRNTSHLSQVRVYRQGEPQDPSLVCLHTLRVRWPRRCDRCRDYFRQGTRKRAVLLGGRFACRARAKPPPLGGGGLQPI